MADITKDQIKEALSQMTVLELSELTKDLEEAWGVEAASAVAVAAAPAAGGDAAAEVKTEFDVVMISFGEKKIGVIKEVRGITGLGLKEAKDLVEGVPSSIKEGVDQEEADKIKGQLEGAGATVEIK
jgi:large subunit ribosomal protein L7/L12